MSNKIIFHDFKFYFCKIYIDENDNKEIKKSIFKEKMTVDCNQRGW